MTKFAFMSFATVGLTLGIATSLKLGNGAVTPNLCDSILSVTSFVNSKDVLNILLHFG
jgi:hypothetical protein